MTQDQQLPDSPFTANSLIEAFGDQAYHKGIRMAVEALRTGDRESCRQLSQANLELMRRGYHKKPEDQGEINKCPAESS